MKVRENNGVIWCNLDLPRTDFHLNGKDNFGFIEFFTCPSCRFLLCLMNPSDSWWEIYAFYILYYGKRKPDGAWPMGTSYHEGSNIVDIPAIHVTNEYLILHSTISMYAHIRYRIRTCVCIYIYYILYIYYIYYILYIYIIYIHTYISYTCYRIHPQIYLFDIII